MAGKFEPADQLDETTWSKAILKTQLNPRSKTGITQTTSTLPGAIQTTGLTTYTLSDILQGVATYKPKIVTLESFNTQLSQELQSLRTQDKYVENQKLSPYDVFLNKPDSSQTLDASTVAATTNQNNNVSGVVPVPGDYSAITLEGKTILWVPVFDPLGPEPPHHTILPNTNAAHQFLDQAWSGQVYISESLTRQDGKGVGGYSNGEHPYGMALDFSVAHKTGPANAEEQALGNSVANWFCANPLVFDISYVIWYDKINNGTGWNPYYSNGGKTQGNDTAQHRDHVHISFNAQSEYTVGSDYKRFNKGPYTKTNASPGHGFAGPMGSSWPGAGEAGSWITP